MIKLGVKMKLTHSQLVLFVNWESNEKDKDYWRRVQTVFYFILGVKLAQV